jgi:AraC-like DNA-binding protein
VNDINLYEKLPQEQYPIRMLWDTENKYDFPSHWHEHIELHYVFEGSCRLKYGEEYYDLEVGDCAIINGNELHRGAGGLCGYIVVLISPEFFESNHVILKKIIRDEYVNELIVKMRDLIGMRGSVDLMEAKGYAYLLVSHLIRNYTVKTLGENTYYKYYDKLDKINVAVSFIKENYDKPLTTKQMSLMVHLSEGYFCQVFKEVTGNTAMEYVNRVRIDKAEKMLKKTEMTITEIAFCCGFGDANYFSRMFKKLKGISPQAIRNKALQ